MRNQIALSEAGAQGGGLELRRVNRNRVYRAVYESGRVSQQELAQRLGLSLPTVAQNLRSLCAEGLLREDGSFASTGGRPAKGVSCVLDARLALGVDVTRRHVSAVLVDPGGRIVRGLRRTLPYEDSPAYYEAFGAIAREAAGEAEPERLLGAGVSFPGILSAGGGIRSSHVLSLGESDGAPFLGAMPCRALFCNDASAAGRAELWDRAGAQNVVYLSLSNSVGGAILLGGRLYEGESLRAAEFGHMTLVPGGKRCYCGKEGCLDAYCAAGVLSEPYGGDLSAFFAALDRGEEKAAALWGGYLDSLACAVNSLHMALDCTVVLGGYVGAYMTPYMDALRARAGARDTFGGDGAYLEPCRYRREASAVGAALLFVEPFLSSI